MNKCALIIITLLMVVGFSPVQAAQIGQPAPNFTAIDSHGQTRHLSDFSGKTIVLEWTNHGCPYVQKHYKSGNMQMTQKSAMDDGAVWLRIISSAPGKQGHVDGAGANAIIDQQGIYATATLLDESGEIGRLYDAKTTPHMYIVDATGTLIYAGAIDDKPSTHAADIDGATNYVLTALSQIKAGKAVAVDHSNPYGCSIKY